MTDLLERLARAPYRLWGLILAALIMTALLGQIVAERIAILSSGTEVRLETVPVDPRDIFRGDYVILTYAISRLPLDRLSDKPDSFAEGDKVYVSLDEGEDGFWHAISISHEPTDQYTTTVPIQGHITWIDALSPVATAPDAGTDQRPCPDCRYAQITYGIESYFVPEGEGLVLEEMRDDGQVAILAAVAENGTAAIKGIILDGGDPVYLEPLI